MTTIKRPGFFQPHTLALAVALGVSASAAHAVNFNIGPIEGQLDSSLSVGASWAMDDADRDFVGTGNGGLGYTTTGDDARLNFKKGETFSKIFKGVHDLELKYGDTGVFVRGKYWYDFELKDESRRFKDIDDSNRKQGAQSSGAEILDAFVYHNYSIGDMPGTVRAGKQVVSWGESTFISNSINSINPIDAAAARRPGAEIKEALLPVNMLYLSQSLTDRLAVEGFYQLEWDQTIAENCGTWFASDVVADGCVDYPALSATSLRSLQPYAGLYSANGIRMTNEGVMLRRGQDRDARDSGQFGLALRWLGDGAEFGAYFMNYHSRTPTVGYQNADVGGINTAFGTGGIYETIYAGAYGQALAGGATAPQAAAIAAGGAASVTQAALLGLGNYYLEYPEDIRLYGLSFATTLPTGTAWSGEVSYRPNMPLLINTTRNTSNLAAVPLGAALTGRNPLLTAGLDNKGYARKDMTQVQTTFTHFFDQVMGAGRFTLVGELGYTRLGALEEQTYGRDGAYGSPFGTGVDNISSARRYGYGGFYTSDSWGYRMKGVWDYSNVFAGVNLSPSISWAHDVDGYSPTFNEGSKALSVGLDANYRNTYTASLSYTDFFGGDYNVMTDRDFLALSVGMNF